MFLVAKAIFLASLFTSARAGIVLGALLFFLEIQLFDSFGRIDVENSTRFEHF